MMNNRLNDLLNILGADLITNHNRRLVRRNRILSKNNTKTTLALDCAWVAFLLCSLQKRRRQRISEGG